MKLMIECRIAAERQKEHVRDIYRLVLTWSDSLWGIRGDSKQRYLPGVTKEHFLQHLGTYVVGEANH